MPAYTIVTTSAVQGGDTAEVNTLTDDFANDSEALGYARRMADEMIDMAHQLLLDFDYSNVGVYEGDLIDEDITPDRRMGARRRRLRLRDRRRIPRGGDRGRAFLIVTQSV